MGLLRLLLMCKGDPRRAERMDRAFMPRRLRLTVVIVCLGLLAAAGFAGFSTGGSTYTVKSGDTLWAISQANGITVSQLAAANDMGVNDLLMIGRRLNIPGSNGVASSPAAPAAASTPATGPGSENPRTFCSTFSEAGGPWGELPWILQASGRLSLQPVFEQWAYHYDLSLPLLEAIAFEESGWQQNVVSDVGAIGIGQIMPATGAFIADDLIGQHMNIHSPSDNIRLSAAFLAYLAGVEGNNVCATIAAYYEGPINESLYGVFPDAQQYVAAVEALIPEFS
jgi:murein DD-endopeptidase MepM/ murein hydrolase activator NlpD